MNKSHFHLFLPKKKIILQIYFIVFIILNIFDFLGLLGGDIDFFKKLLSWAIIGYIFYKASFTKLFLGTRDRVMDLLLILSFALMSIVKSLMHYVNLPEIKQATFYIFGFLITPLQNVSNRTQFELTTFAIGLIFTVLIAIVLLRTYKPTRDSLVGSFNISGYFKFIGGEYMILIATLIFFSTIVFNFFMEWFALAVDSIILVLGLIYYLIIYIHTHTKVDKGKYLSEVSNTGNQFYQNLIENFADRKTFMIGVSIILTIHLIVDVGVYMFPYLFGTSNSLYSSSIGTPIFNFIDPTNSQIMEDLQKFDNVIFNLTLFLGHLYTLLFFILVMLGPFYYFYKFVQGYRTHSPNSLKHIFLVGVIVYLSLCIMPGVNEPISISVPNSGSGVVGVEFTTSPIISEYTGNTPISLIALLTIIIIANIEIYQILFRSDHYFLKYKLMPIISIISFVIYISFFFYSTIDNQSQIFQDTFIPENLKDTSQKYNNILMKANNNEVTKFKLETITAKQYNYSIAITLLKEDIDDGNYNAYALINFLNSNKELRFEIDDTGSMYFQNTEDYKNNRFTNYQTSMIYYMGENIPIVDKFSSAGEYTAYINQFISIPSIKKTSANIVIEVFRLVFTVVFYIFGTIAFVRYFYREKILD